MGPYKRAISAERREKLIVGAAAAVTGIYRYFKPTRSVEKQPLKTATTFRRTAPKCGVIPCPCGSGKEIQAVLWKNHAPLTASSYRHTAICMRIILSKVRSIFSILPRMQIHRSIIERFYARTYPSRRKWRSICGAREWRRQMKSYSTLAWSFSKFIEMSIRGAKVYCENGTASRALAAP